MSESITAADLRSRSRTVSAPKPGPSARHGWILRVFSQGFGMVVKSSACCWARYLSQRFFHDVKTVFRGLPFNGERHRSGSRCRKLPAMMLIRPFSKSLAR